MVNERPGVLMYRKRRLTSQVRNHCGQHDRLGSSVRQIHYRGSQKRHSGTEDSLDILTSRIIPEYGYPPVFPPPSSYGSSLYAIPSRRWNDIVAHSSLNKSILLSWIGAKGYNICLSVGC